MCADQALKAAKAKAGLLAWFCKVTGAGAVTVPLPGSNIRCRPCLN